MSESKYGAGFAIRMLILLVLLGLALYGFYYDRFVLVPQAEKGVNDAYVLLTRKTDDGGGIPKDEVQKAIGFPPVEKFEERGFEVERYEFRRLLPMAKTRYLTVVYEGGGLVQILDSEPFDPDDVREKVDIPLKEPSPDSLPQSALGGPAPSSDDDKDAGDGDEEGDSDEGDADSESDDAADAGDGDADDSEMDDASDNGDQEPAESEEGEEAETGDDDGDGDADDSEMDDASDDGE